MKPTRERLLELKNHLADKKDGDPESWGIIREIEDIHSWIGGPFQSQRRDVETARKVIDLALDKINEEEE